MENKVILVTGTRCVGKDTFVSLFTKNKLIPDKKFVRFAFADELKHVCADLSLHLLDKGIFRLEKEDKEIFRPILIAVGMVARKIDPLFWVKTVYSKIQSAIEDEKPVPFIPIISDCRFPNEIDFFIKNYGKSNICVVRITRGDNPEPTEEEKINDPLIDPYVNFTINWPKLDNPDNISDLNFYAQEFWDFYKKEFLNSTTGESKPDAN